MKTDIIFSDVSKGLPNSCHKMSTIRSYLIIIFTIIINWRIIEIQLNSTYM